jgi:hypothetical protein
MEIWTVPDPKRDVFQVTIIFKSNPTPLVFDCYKFNINKTGTALNSMTWELVDADLNQFLFTDISEIVHIRSRLKARGRG